MHFRTILAILGGGDMSKDLQRAIDLAAQVGAHLSVVALKVSMAATMSDYPIDTDWLDRRRAHQEAFRGQAEAAMQGCIESRVSFDTASFYDGASFLSEEVSRRAFYADLILLGSEAVADQNLVDLVIDGGLFQARCPVLLLPEGGTPTLRPERIVLGWNDRIEAVEAARKCLEVLQGAQTHVTLVDPDTPRGEEAGEPGAEIATYLARHGVSVTVDQLASGGRDVAHVLYRHAMDVSADMLIIGAYGRSRLRQWIFGGVTSSVLKDVRLPTLLVR